MRGGNCAERAADIRSHGRSGNGRRHETQLAIHPRLAELMPAQQEALWGTQTFYRSSSVVNGGRQVVSDLFEGVRGASSAS